MLGQVLRRGLEGEEQKLEPPKLVGPVRLVVAWQMMTSRHSHVTQARRWTKIRDR